MPDAQFTVGHGFSRTFGIQSLKQDWRAPMRVLGLALSPALTLLQIAVVLPEPSPWAACGLQPSLITCSHSTKTVTVLWSMNSRHILTSCCAQGCTDWLSRSGLCPPWAWHSPLWLGGGPQRRMKTRPRQRTSCSVDRDDTLVTSSQEAVSNSLVVYSVWYMLQC